MVHDEPCTYPWCGGRDGYEMCYWQLTALSAIFASVEQIPTQMRPEMGPLCYITPGGYSLHVAMRMNVAFRHCVILCKLSCLCCVTILMILGGGLTQIHQDGHGTVDSGHSNLSGYNEVVMLRRLPECHKLNACALIQQLGHDRKPIKLWICYTSCPMLMDGKMHPNGQQQRPSKVWRTWSKCTKM